MSRKTKPSLRKAINQHCRECIYDPISGQGSWRQQVTDCTSKDCSLYPVRPRAAKKLVEQREAKE